MTGTAAPLKRIAELRVDRRRTTPDGMLTLNVVEGRSGRLLTDPWAVPVPPPEAGVADVASGDVLFGKLRPYLAKVAHASRPAYASTELLCLRPKPLVDSRWFFYRMLAHPTVAWAVATSEGTKMPRTSWDRLGEFCVQVPKLDEQRATADYLNTETARIDSLIAKKRRLMSLLQERRQGIVDETVRAGDEVPVRRLICRLTSGPRGWAEHVFDAGETPFLRITNISRDDIELDRENLIRVVSPRNAEATRTAVRNGDVLVSITADIGSVGIAREEDAGAAVSQHVALLTPRGCEPEWLAYSIASSFARCQLDAGQYGGTKTQLSLGDVANVKILLPSRDEQRRRLVDFRQELGRPKRARAALRAQLALLREHRQALITAAVTGELEIPGVG